MDADVFISLTHFKGHEMTRFGGAIKKYRYGMRFRAGKTEQHRSEPHILPLRSVVGCKRCQRECANGGLVFDEAAKKMTVDTEHCVGCGRCLGVATLMRSHLMTIMQMKC